MMKKRLSRLALILLFAFILSPATRPEANDELRATEESTAAQKAKPERSDREYKDGGEWFGRAYELHQSDRYPEAIEAFKRSIDLGHRKATAMYNIACGYSMMNDKENALEWLERALDNGFDGSGYFAEDSDLDPLRTDPRFKTLLERAAKSGDADRSSKAIKKRDRLEQANLDFNRLDKEASQDGDQWYEVGSQLLRLRDFDRSIIALNKAINHLGYKSENAMYNLACAHALKGDRETALDWLEKSINAGFDNSSKLRNDPDIGSLRTDPRFDRIEKWGRTLSLSQFSGDSSFDDSPYSKQRWAPAVELYRSFVTNEPGNGRAWFNFGYALHYSREHARAIEAFERALQIGYRKPTTMYNLACAYSMLDQRDTAFQWLAAAVEAGFEISNYVGGDRDLDNLRSDPRFKRFADLAWDRQKYRHKK